MDNNSNILHSNICGNKIVKVIFIHDYIQLVFDNNSVLNLNNKVTIDLSDNQPDCRTSLMLDDVNLIENNIVKNIIIKSNEYFKIILTNDICIEMSMRHEDYNGPEAFEFYDKELMIIDDGE